MLKLVVRRLLSAIAVLFVVSLITFVVLLCIPGDPAQLILGVEATPEKVEALRASMGLDRPWYVQYMHWIQGVLTGNWGTSYLYGENVWTLICQRLPVTFSVALLSMAAALVVSAILGILAALKKGSPVDLLSRTVMQIGGAVPSFWLAMLFMLLFSSYLGWFPVTGYTAPGENFGCVFEMHRITFSGAGYRGTGNSDPHCAVIHADGPATGFYDERKCERPASR